MQTDDLAAQMVREMLPAINSVSDMGYIEAIARRHMEKLFTEDEIRRGTWELTDYINPDDIIREIRTSRAKKDSDNGR